MRRKKIVGVAFLLFAIVAIAVLGFILYELWNALMPAIFGLPRITIWQAFGLFVLSRILFGRFGGRWGHKRHWPRFVGNWSQLTPEERERFRRAMGDRFPGKFGGDESPGEV